MTFSRVRLGHVAVIRNGGTPSADTENWDGGVPFITPPDLRGLNGGVVEETGRSLTPEGAARGSTLVDRGVILSCRAPIGYVGRVRHKSAFNQGCKVLQSEPGLDDRFLAYVLLSERPALEVLGRGTTFMELAASELASLQIPLPAVAEQRRIADYLDRETATIDALIEKQHRLIRRLHERRGAVREDLVNRASEGAPLVTYRHVIRRIRQGWSPQCNNWPASEGQWRVLRVGCVNHGSFRPEENKELPADLEPRAGTVVRAGELLVSRANTRDLVGSAAAVTREYPRLMLSDKLYAITHTPQVAPEFMALMLGTSRYRELIELEATGASPSMQNISQEVLLSLKVPVLDLDVQQQVIHAWEKAAAAIDALIAKAERFIELAQERRAALITAAVTGQLEIPAEESAA